MYRIIALQLVIPHHRNILYFEFHRGVTNYNLTALLYNADISYRQECSNSCSYYIHYLRPVFRKIWIREIRIRKLSDQRIPGLQKILKNISNKIFFRSNIFLTLNFCYFKFFSTICFASQIQCK